jgi:peroxiredoxin
MRQISRFSPQNQMRRQMVILWVVGVMLTSGLLIACLKDTAVPPNVGDEAPNFSLKSLTGERITLKGLAQKGPVLVAFFATWCAPCKAEAPILSEIHEKYQDKGLTVVGVSVGEKKEVVASFCEKNDIKYAVLLDADEVVAKVYGMISAPLNVVLNQQRIVLFRGGQIDEQMPTTLQAMLAKNSASVAN